MEDFYKKYYFGVKKFVGQKIDDEGVVEEITNDVLMAAMMCKSNFNGQCSEIHQRWQSSSNAYAK